MSEQGITVRLLDCDVEAPNAHIFLKPRIMKSHKVNVSVPVVDEEKCDGCGRCGEVCRFSAIAVLAGTVMTFPSLCHGCGGCGSQCPRHAIKEGRREIGTLETGTSGGMEFAMGRLRVGEAMSPPLIRALKKLKGKSRVTIIDCPPGTSCPVIQSVRGADYVVLVTEPTPFGLHDLELAVDVVRELGIPFGIVINRMGIGDSRVLTFCAHNVLELIGEIPDDRRVAETYSRGIPPMDAAPGFREIFRGLSQRILDRAAACGTGAAV
jgi:MinD superfamily P-loop ATPase